jgi:hypothetical protein
MSAMNIRPAPRSRQFTPAVFTPAVRRILCGAVIQESGVVGGGGVFIGVSGEGSAAVW